MLWPTQLITSRLREANIGAKTLFNNVSPVLASRPAWQVLRSRAKFVDPQRSRPQRRSEIDVRHPQFKRRDRIQATRRQRGNRCGPTTLVSSPTTRANPLRPSAGSVDAKFTTTTSANSFRSRNSAKSAWIRSIASLGVALSGVLSAARLRIVSPTFHSTPGRMLLSAASRSSRQAGQSVGIEDAALLVQLFGFGDERCVADFVSADDETDSSPQAGSPRELWQGAHKPCLCG